MKTLDEALALIMTKDGRSAEQVTEHATRYADIATEILSNANAQGLILSHLIESKDPIVAVFGVFVSGVMIGMEMEKP